MPGNANQEAPQIKESAEQARQRAARAEELARQAQEVAAEAARVASEIEQTESAERAAKEEAERKAARYVFENLVDSLLTCVDCGVYVSNVDVHEAQAHTVLDWRTVADPRERQRLRRAEMDERRGGRTRPLQS